MSAVCLFAKISDTKKPADCSAGFLNSVAERESADLTSTTIYQKLQLPIKSCACIAFLSIEVYVDL